MFSMFLVIFYFIGVNIGCLCCCLVRVNMSMFGVYSSVDSIICVMLLVYISYIVYMVVSNVMNRLCWCGVVGLV